MAEPTAETTRLTTGIAGLDRILLGGFPANRSYLVQGTAGSGKTTLGLHFLLEGRRVGETGYYVSLSETKEELLTVAASHGWSLDGISLLELENPGHYLRREDQYTVFPADEVELGETTERILEEWERIRPVRVVIDSLADIRLMARDNLRYRRQVLGLKQFMTSRTCTVLLLDDQPQIDPDLELHSISHGVIALRRLERPYGVPRRQLRVGKLRGSAFLEGEHDYVIRKGGLRVFPRIVCDPNVAVPVREPLSSGIADLDQLMGGGLRFATTTLFMGPPGAGKSSLSTQYLWAACERGEAAACFLFEESPEQFLRRAAASGRDLGPHVRSGQLSVQAIDPTKFSPGELEDIVRSAVEGRQVRVVMIDSINGYFLGMPSEQSLILQLHELLSYLASQGVLTLLTLAESGLVSELRAPIALSYLCDALIQLRFFEAFGEIRQAISVLKARDNLHEHSIRQFQLTPSGIHIGDTLRDFRGVLSGTPDAMGMEKVLY